MIISRTSIFMHRIHLIIFIILATLTANAVGIEVMDNDGNGLQVREYPAEGDLLLIWLDDFNESRPLLDELLESIQATGIEIWRVDILGDYFFERSSESVRTLSGEPVHALIKAANELKDKRILLSTYERMALPLLRGAHQWLQQNERGNLNGAILLYPNLFGPTPAAGEPPVLDPIVYANTLPLMIYQPEQGNHRWRLDELMDALWGHSVSAVYLAPEIRDWFIMGMDPPTRAERLAIDALPSQFRMFSRWLSQLTVSKPRSDINITPPPERAITTLTKVITPYSAPQLKLTGRDGNPYELVSDRGSIVLVNFWATWCPPCVEEVPSMNDLLRRYKGRPFKVVSIDFRETKETIDEFAAKTPIEFPVLLDLTGQTSKEWEVFRFPTSFMVDADGQIRYSANRAIDWNSPQVWDAVDELLQDL